MLALSLIALIQPSAQATTRTLTPAQRARVYDALIADGLAPADADAIASDYDQAILIPTGTVEEVQTGKGKADGGFTPMSIGDCSGNGSGYVWRTQYVNNTLGSHMAYVKLYTHYSYNGSRVTCASTSRSWYIYSWASQTVTFEGYTDYNEYFYTSGGRVNGGALAEVEAKFGHCLLRYGCVGYWYPWAQTRAYYNGTSMTFGGSKGTGVVS